VRTHHARVSRAPAPALWQAARSVEVRETVSLRPLIAWRLGAHAPRGDEPFSAVFARHPFHLLAEDGWVTVSGLGGKLWSLRGDYATFGSPAEFRAWAPGGTCKVALRHEVREHPRGAEIVSEARVWCTSPGAWRRFRPYWAVVGPFSRFIGGELLSAAVRRAERTSSATA
jgi:hypothetical protein